MVIVALSVVDAGTVVPVAVATAVVPAAPPPVGAARVRVGSVVQLVAPEKVMPVTTQPVRTAVAVGLLVQVPFTVTTGAEVYPVPPLVTVALIHVTFTVAVAAAPPPVGAARVRVGSVVQLVAPEKVMPVTTQPVRTAVAVGLLVQVPFTVTTGAEVYPVPPLVTVALIHVTFTVAVAAVLDQAPHGPLTLR